MSQRPALCCPDPAVKNPLFPRDIPDSKKGVPVTPGLSCENPLFVTTCGDQSEPVPVTLEGQDCTGAPVEVTGNKGEITHVVQAPGTVFSVKLCEEDRDFELACGVDPATGHQVQTAYKITAGEFVLIKRWDVVTGAEWTGDPATLEGCGGTKLESEQEIFCDGANTFLRWFILKDGQPTGQYVDTDFSGAAYTPAGPVSHGECKPQTEQSVSSATADDLSGLLAGTSFSIWKSECCSIRLVTSIGAIVIPKKATAYSTQTFKTPFTVTAVEVVDGTCDLSEITVISNLSS